MISMSTPSRSRTPNRSSMTCFGSEIVSFTPSVKLLRVGGAVEPRLFGDEAVDAVARDHDRGGDIAVGTIRANSGDNARRSARLPAQQPGHRRVAQQRGAGGDGVVGQPAVEIGSICGRTVVWRPSPCVVAEVDRQRMRVGEDHRRPAGDPPLDRRPRSTTRVSGRRGSAGRRPRRTCSCCPGTGRARAAACAARRGPPRSRRMIRPGLRRR